MRSLIVAIIKDRRLHRLALVGGAVLVMAVLWAWHAGVDLQTAKDLWAGLEEFLSKYPWWLFAALVVLPGLPVPSSALLLLAGAVWGERPVMACGICLLSTWLNQTWTYWLAAGPGRRMVERWIKQGAVNLPSRSDRTPVQLLLLLRLTPGMPLFFQNYVLGFLRVPFISYSWISIACTGMFVCGVVLAGAGVSTGSWMPALTGIAVLLVAVVAVQMVRGRLRRPNVERRTSNVEL